MGRPKIEGHAHAVAGDIDEVCQSSVTVTHVYFAASCLSPCIIPTKQCQYPNQQIINIKPHLLDSVNQGHEQ